MLNIEAILSVADTGRGGGGREGPATTAHNFWALHTSNKHSMKYYYNYSSKNTPPCIYFRIRRQCMDSNFHFFCHV
jgi:hypothetical protein